LQAIIKGNGHKQQVLHRGGGDDGHIPTTYEPAGRHIHDKEEKQIGPEAKELPVGAQ